MTRASRSWISAAGAGALLALTAATHPAALAQVSPGLWELNGFPGTKGPVRLCVADPVDLARLEHRAKSCSDRLINDTASSTTIAYDCAGAGFGRSKIDVITPRSLRIGTQGIADSLPFNYVLEARRIGDCAKTDASVRH